jgi:pimeloyl-ACP methyl ester carboxylesterase
MQLRHQESGTGRPAVLVHSGGLSSRQWKKLTRALEGSRRVIAPDLLGYGLTGAWPANEDFHFRQDVAALQALVTSLDEPVDLVGHSYGGFLALQVALAIPDRVRTLSLYEPVAFAVLRDEERSLLPTIAAFEGDGESWLEAFVDGWNGPGAWAAMTNDAKQPFRDVAWKLSREVVTLADDHSDYSAIAVPTLLMGGQRTPEFEKRTLQRLHETIAGSKLRMVPGAGHMGPITHGDAVNGAIAAHIE